MEEKRKGQEKGFVEGSQRLPGFGSIVSIYFFFAAFLSWPPDGLGIGFEPAAPHPSPRTARIEISCFHHFSICFEGRAPYGWRLETGSEKRGFAPSFSSTQK